MEEYFARFYVFPGQQDPARIKVPATFLDNDRFLWPNAPIDTGLLKFSSISTPGFAIQSNEQAYEVTFETTQMSVIQRHLVLEDVGPVWHLWLAPTEAETPTPFEAFRKTPAALSVGVLVTIVAMYVLNVLIPYMTEPLETLGKIVFHLTAITTLALVALSIGTSLYLITKSRYLLAGMAIFSFIPGTYVFISLYGMLAQPDIVPGVGGIGYYDYLLAFTALQSQTLNVLTPLLPVVTFILQALGLKFVSDALGLAHGLTQKDGAMVDYVATTRGDKVTAITQSPRPKARPNRA